MNNFETDLKQCALCGSGAERIRYKFYCKTCNVHLGDQPPKRNTRFASQSGANLFVSST